jgi:hypothetical protein
MKFDDLYNYIISEKSRKSKRAQAMKNNPTTTGTANLQNPITVATPKQVTNQNYRNQVAAQAAAAQGKPTLQPQPKVTVQPQPNTAAQAPAAPVATKKVQPVQKAVQNDPLAGAQQKYANKGIAAANTPARASASSILGKVVSAPIRALQKGIGAYSAITNAPRALGQSLKAAAGGDPYRLQQQIGSIPRAVGLPAIPPTQTQSSTQPQVANVQQKIDDLIQRIRKNPNDQQAIIALKSLKG